MCHLRLVFLSRIDSTHQKETRKSPLTYKSCKCDQKTFGIVIVWNHIWKGATATFLFLQIDHSFSSKNMVPNMTYYYSYCSFVPNFQKGGGLAIGFMLKKPPTSCPTKNQIVFFYVLACLSGGLQFRMINTFSEFCIVKQKNPKTLFLYDLPARPTFWKSLCSPPPDLFRILFELLLILCSFLQVFLQ